MHVIRCTQITQKVFHQHTRVFGFGVPTRSFRIFLTHSWVSPMLAKAIHWSSVAPENGLRLRFSKNSSVFATWPPGYVTSRSTGEVAVGVKECSRSTSGRTPLSSLRRTRTKEAHSFAWLANDPILGAMTIEANSIMDSG
eukprot:86254_1